jgi:hypothetical protein
MQQIWGGHGYIAESGMEQFVRDARIAMIYEGANGVQAMDLVGRKLPMNGGRAVQAFKLVDDECASAADSGDAVALVAERLGKANGELKAATVWFLQHGMTDRNALGAGAYAYMTLMGIVSLGLMWLKMAKVAAAALAAGTDDTLFYEAKLVTAKHFARALSPGWRIAARDRGGWRNRDGTAGGSLRHGLMAPRDRLGREGLNRCQPSWRESVAAFDPAEIRCDRMRLPGSRFAARRIARLSQSAAAMLMTRRPARTAVEDGDA